MAGRHIHQEVEEAVGTVNVDIGVFGDSVGIAVAVTAISGTLDVSLQWSPDGTNWVDGETADSFTQFNATGGAAKRFDVKAERCRVKFVVATDVCTFSASSYS